MEDKIKQLLAAAGDGAYISTQSGPRAHKLVKKQAWEFCAALHDSYASKWDAFAKQWPTPQVFADKFWPHFCDEARATLSRILSKSQNPRLQEEVFDALIKDQSLAPSRANIPQVKMDL